MDWRSHGGPPGKPAAFHSPWLAGWILARRGKSAVRPMKDRPVTMGFLPYPIKEWL